VPRLKFFSRERERERVRERKEV